MDIALLHLVGVDFAGDHPAQLRQLRFEILGVGDVLESVEEQLGGGVAEQIAEGLVDFEPAAFG